MLPNADKDSEEFYLGADIQMQTDKEQAKFPNLHLAAQV